MAALANTDPDHAWLGRQAYKPLWEQLNRRARQVAAGEAAEIVWACEHEPVYTTGRRGVDNRTTPVLPAPLIKTDRGGETTFHGPGQLMLYPIVNLSQRSLGVRDYACMLEQSCIDLLAGLGIQAQRQPGFPGVWLGNAKIAALGLRIQRGVAYHGMALNVEVDARWFDAIDACGTGLASTNVSKWLARVPPMPELASTWTRIFMEGIASFPWIYTAWSNRYGSRPCRADS